jgi:hypothetical protein
MYDPVNGGVPTEMSRVALDVWVFRKDSILHVTFSCVDLVSGLDHPASEWPYHNLYSVTFSACVWKLLDCSNCKTFRN